jgi:hypothetical protein
MKHTLEVGVVRCGIACMCRVCSVVDKYLCEHQPIGYRRGQRRSARLTNLVDFHHVDEFLVDAWVLVRPHRSDEFVQVGAFTLLSEEPLNTPHYVSCRWSCADEPDKCHTLLKLPHPTHASTHRIHSHTHRHAHKQTHTHISSSGTLPRSALSIVRAFEYILRVQFRVEEAQVIQVTCRS